MDPTTDFDLAFNFNEAFIGVDDEVTVVTGLKNPFPFWFGLAGKPAFPSGFRNPFPFWLGLVGGGAVVPPVEPPRPIPPDGGGAGGPRPRKAQYESAVAHYRKKLRKKHDQIEELEQLEEIVGRLAEQAEARHDLDAMIESPSNVNAFYEHFNETLLRAGELAARQQKQLIRKLIAEAQEAERMEAELQDEDEIVLLLFA